jgi:hypothetical protein
MCKEPASSAASQPRFSQERAARFCGKCGRPIEPGQTSCGYCSSEEAAGKTGRVSGSKKSVAAIIAVAAVCVVAILLLLSRLLNGSQNATQSVQAPQTLEEPQTEQNPEPDQTTQTQQPSSAKQLYYAYFAEYFGWDNKLEDPAFENATNRYNAFLADLTHDGEDEMIVLDNTYGMDGITLTVYTCRNDSVVGIYTVESTFDPRDKTLGLYENAGNAYLLVCYDGMSMFGGEAYYHAFSFTSNGDANDFLYDSFSETLDPETDEVSDDYYALLEKMEELKQIH